MRRGLRLAAGAWAVAVALAACGETPRTVNLRRLAPEADPLCGAPSDARTLRVAAVGDFSLSDGTARSVEIGLGEPLTIDAFPLETRALEVEVLGAGGALRAVGRTETFDGETLANGEEIAVFMAPPNGTCLTGPPTRARSGALLAVTGEEVVVVGGVDSAGIPVSRPEVYSARTARFTEIAQDLYGDVENGLVGASLTPMTDGRIALIGGGQNAFQVYTPEAGRFSEPPLLLQQARAFHAAVALDDEQVFLAGGCSMVEDGACVPGSENSGTAILRITTGELDPGPPLMFVRVGAKAFLEPDGRVIIVGGSLQGAPVLSAERVDPQRADAAETLDGVGLVGVELASGAVVTAFGPEMAPSGSGTSFAPGGTRGVDLVPAPSRGSPTLTALESGRVLAYGGSGGTAEAITEAALLAPIAGRWTDLETVTREDRHRHASALLPDGSVLIVGGQRADGEHLGDARIFRPDLLGPLTGDVTVNFADESAEQLVARDRSAIAVVNPGGGAPAFLRMTARATDENIPGEWAIVAAPLLERSEVELTLSSEGGFAVLTAFDEPTTFRVTLVLPDEPIIVVDVLAGSVRAVSGCVGDAPTSADLINTNRWRHTVGDGQIDLFLGDRPMLQCEADTPRAGRVGIGPLGNTGIELQLFQLTVTR